MPKDHDGYHQDQPDKKIENNHVKTAEQDGFSRDAGAGDLHNALGIEKNKGHRGNQRRQKRPDVAEEGLAVLRAEIADEEAPGEFATCPDVAGDRANELGGMTEERLRRVNADGKIRHIVRGESLVKEGQRFRASWDEPQRGGRFLRGFDFAISPVAISRGIWLWWNPEPSKECRRDDFLVLKQPYDGHTVHHTKQ